MRLALRSFLLALVVIAAINSRAAAETVLKPGDRVAIVGDSITEQKLYSKYMEAYLLASSGVPELSVMQFGWGGERADGFAARAENDLSVFKPTVATTCYGMNDGGYQPWKNEIGVAYENNMRSVIKNMQALGVRSIVVGSPGAVDTYFFRPGQKLGNEPAHVAYNDNLAHLRDIAKKLAGEYKQPFGNVHDAMYDTMQKAQMELGDKYPVCGGDGFHPGPNGQLIMAYAFLKGLGVDGDIGTIIVDLAGKSESTKGHAIVSSSGGKVEVKSTRWPFCFDGDAKGANGTRSITPFLPFNQDLNRFTLKVKGLKSDKAKVQWGSETKEFSKDQLESGINLTAEFTATPFDADFQRLIAALGEKQAFETYMIKSVITQFRSYPKELKDDAELAKALATVKERFAARQQALDAAAKKTIVPVTHTLVISE
jgi:lysophospholipase L1-like esterase